MLRRHLFVAAVFLALLLSAAFTPWTSDAGGAGKQKSLAGMSFPPDTTSYTRPALPNDVKVSIAGKGLSPGFPPPVDIPGSSGGEPDIAINPGNPNQIVVHGGFGGWNGNAPNFVSNDGGLTWTTVNQIPPPNGAPNTSGCPCDITHDWGMDGNLYGAYLTANTDIFSASNSNPIFGGLFSYFLIAGNAQLTDFNGTLGQADQPWLLTDPDPITSTQTNTYVAYDDFGVFPVGERVSVALGTSPPDFTKDNQSGLSSNGGVINPGHRLAVDPRTGTIYSLYQSCVSCGGSPKAIAYILNRSQDAGTTWGFPGFPNGVTLAVGSTVQPTPKFGTANALLGGIDHAAVDPTTSAVYVVFGDSNGSPSQGIFIEKITFDNASPSNPIFGAVHAVSPSFVEAALPSVAVAPDGTVGVLYTTFDGFDVNGFPIYSAHFDYSTDGGVHFVPKTLLTFLSVAKDNGNSRQRVLGDYQQLKVVPNPTGANNSGTTFYGVFTGNAAALGGATANNDAIFFKVTLAPQINLNESTVPIGNVCVGSTGTAQLQVSNTGADNLIISSITGPLGGPISLVSGPNFPVNISPDANFNFAFQCTPTVPNQSLTSMFTINSNDPANPKTSVSVTCIVGRGAINVTGSGNFGTASCTNTTPPQTLTLNNVGNCNLNITSAAITSCPGGDFKLVNPLEFPATISPDASLPVGILFTPSSAGPKTCTLTITSNDPINPVVIIPLIGNTLTGTASLNFPAGITFPPTVIQQDSACPDQIGVPIVNNGTCPVKINSVGLTESSSPQDYSLTGLPGLPLTLTAGQQLGSGDLDLVFEPFTVAQESTGTVDVNFVNDPITGATSTVHVPFCGEAVNRGFRVLVTQGGSEVSVVKRIELQSAFGPEQPNGNFFVHQVIKNAALQTVSGSPPCPSFDFHAEFGGSTNPKQLKDGTYRLKVEIKEGKKTKTRIVRLNMDTCTFTPNVVVAFP